MGPRAQTIPAQVHFTHKLLNNTVMNQPNANSKPCTYLTPPSFVPGLEVLHILHLVRLAQFMLPHLEHK